MIITGGSHFMAEAWAKKALAEGRLKDGTYHIDKILKLYNEYLEAHGCCGSGRCTDCPLDESDDEDED